MRSICLIVHNIRSAHNVGSLLRTADGLGIEKVYLTGYTPYPLQKDDERLPHLAAKIERQIAKVALGAEKTVIWEHFDNIKPVLDELKNSGYVLAALEQTPGSIELPKYETPDKIALIVGREVEGLEPEIVAKAEVCLEIPMLGSKESFNVSIAAAMALYYLRFC